MLVRRLYFHLSGNSCFPLMAKVVRSSTLKQYKNLASQVLDCDIVAPTSLQGNVKWTMQYKLFLALQDQLKQLSGCCLNCFFSLKKVSRCSSDCADLCDKCNVVMQCQKACFFLLQSDSAKQDCMLFNRFSSLKERLKSLKVCFSCLCPVASFPLTISKNKFHSWNGPGTTNIGPNCNCVGKGIVEKLVFRYLYSNAIFMTEIILSYGVSNDSMEARVNILGNMVEPYGFIGAVVCFLHYCLYYIYIGKCRL
jgi:hypothetical protein